MYADDNDVFTTPILDTNYVNLPKDADLTTPYSPPNNQKTIGQSNYGPVSVNQDTHYSGQTTMYDPQKAPNLPTGLNPTNPMNQTQQGNLNKQGTQYTQFSNSPSMYHNSNYDGGFNPGFDPEQNPQLNKTIEPLAPQKSM
jgi:hypothetical protein